MSADPMNPTRPPAGARRELLHVDAERLRADLDALAAIGRTEDFGVSRRAFSDADMAARRWLAERIEAAGLASWMDGAGNVYGRCEPPDGAPSAGTEPGAILIGSHVDSVPGGGTLDGALGVVAGLECLRRLKETGAPLARPVEVVAFADEEGRFGGLFGSSAVAGNLTPGAIHQAQDLDGVRLVDAMATWGLDAMEALHAQRPRPSIARYLELHIEQGPVLDVKEIPIGIVETITGLFKWSVRLIGAADHAGTTPMDMRRDAFLGLAEFAGELGRILEEHGGPESKATIGKVELTPGAANSVPGLAEFSLDVRDVKAERLTELASALRRALAAIARRRGLMFEFDVLSEVAPADCDPATAACLERQAQALGLGTLRMPSGAAHDCQIMAPRWPSALLFVPSKDGRSHSSAEWTPLEQIVAGVDVLLNAVAELAAAAEPVESPHDDRS